MTSRSLTINCLNSVVPPQSLGTPQITQLSYLHTYEDECLANINDDKDKTFEISPY
ncbi:unnamed protein product [Paramecium primaurelia]|uniref:Uncharacterized protein n=1 Tax=Paramecium primaurelia TaxID=5886 RepID=A0A8S1K063_PARPR|nr:unnamed protein product [Paramecium primaurelia]